MLNKKVYANRRKKLKENFKDGLILIMGNNFSLINPDKLEAFKLAESLRDEFVIRAHGVVAERGEGLKNPNIASGNVEIVVEELEVLNRAETLPIQPFAEDNQANEDLRFKYRYLDLRRPKMQEMLQKTRRDVPTDASVHGRP